MFLDIISPGWPQGVDAPEEILENPQVAEGQGYSESKWVSERVLNIAAQKTALRPVIMRLGQMAGGSNGAWQ